MATNSSFPQGTQYSTGAASIKFAPIQDSESGDDMLEPPFVRVRSGNTAFMYVDTSPETQVAAINKGSWVVGGSQPGINSHIDARKQKRMAIVGASYMWSTPNVNPTNNTVTFRIQGFPLLNLTAVLPTYNYRRLFSGFTNIGRTAGGTPLLSGPPAVVTALPDIDGYGEDIDPEDGILDKLAQAMSAALFAAGSPVTMSVVASDGYRDMQISNYNNTNVLFWRMAPSAGTFIFTGGSLFERGQYLLGLTAPVPGTDFADLGNYYIAYRGGPVSFLYTRWLDVTSRTLAQNSKIPSAGTNIPPNLIFRIYITPAEVSMGVHFIKVDTGNLQWINWRKSQAINAIDIQVRDEFGDLVEIPNPSLVGSPFQSNNPAWFSLVFLNEL